MNNKSELNRKQVPWKFGNTILFRGSYSTWDVKGNQVSSKEKKKKDTSLP